MAPTRNIRAIERQIRLSKAEVVISRQQFESAEVQQLLGDAVEAIPLRHDRFRLRLCSGLQLEFMLRMLAMKHGAEGNS